jgi:hypothetical protein
MLLMYYKNEKKYREYLFFPKKNLSGLRTVVRLFDVKSFSKTGDGSHPNTHSPLVPPDFDSWCLGFGV